MGVSSVPLRMNRYCGTPYLLEGWRLKAFWQQLRSYKPPTYVPIARVKAKHAFTGMLALLIYGVFTVVVPESVGSCCSLCYPRIGTCGSKSPRSWSKQHSYIRYKRPLVDHSARSASKLQIKQEWWKEKAYRPKDLFMGFPEVQEYVLRGNSMYIERMNGTTLSMVLDKCVLDGITDSGVMSKLCRRAQQIAHTLKEPQLLAIYRSFSQLDVFDYYFKVTLLGRIGQRLFYLKLRDCATIIEAMNNAKFNENKYLTLVLKHSEALIKNREDIPIEDLCYFLGTLRNLQETEYRVFLRPIGDLLNKKSLMNVNAAYIIEAFNVMVLLNFKDLQVLSSLFSIIKRKVDEIEHQEDYLKLIVAISTIYGKLQDFSFVILLRDRLLPYRYKMLVPQMCACVYALAKCGCLNSEAVTQFTIGISETIDSLSIDDLCSAFNGFLRSKEDIGKIMDLLLPRIRASVHQCTAAQLIKLYDAFTGPNADIANPYLEQLLISVINRLKSLLTVSATKTSDIAAFLDACGYIQPSDIDFMRLLFEITSSVLEEFDDHQLNNVLWMIGNIEEKMFLDLNFLSLFKKVLLKVEKKLIANKTVEAIDIVLNIFRCLLKCSSDYRAKKQSFIIEYLSFFEKNVSHMSMRQLEALIVLVQLYRPENTHLTDQISQRVAKMRNAESGILTDLFNESSAANRAFEETLLNEDQQ